MARYDIKFGGRAGNARFFGELVVEGVFLDDAATRSISVRAVEVVGELVAEGMQLHPSKLEPLGEALAARIAAAIPGAACRIATLVAP